MEEEKPQWMTVAEAEIGVKEVRGASDNPRIMEYHRSTIVSGEHDEIPWCSAFVNWVLRKSGFEGTRSGVARSWQYYGQELKEPRYGCIVVMPRGKSTWQGHVGFLVGKDGNRIKVLGGNQSDAVTIATFPISSVIAWRWPWDDPKKKGKGR